MWLTAAPTRQPGCTSSSDSGFQSQLWHSCTPRSLCCVWPASWSAVFLPGATWPRALLPTAPQDGREIPCGHLLILPRASAHLGSGSDHSRSHCFISKWKWKNYHFFNSDFSQIYRIIAFICLFISSSYNERHFLTVVFLEWQLWIQLLDTNIYCALKKKKVYAAPKERAVGQLAVGWELQERH